MLGIDVRTFRRHVAKGEAPPPAYSGGGRTKRWLVSQFFDAEGIPVAIRGNKGTRGHGVAEVA